jgi:hypothetical protein
MHKDIKIHLSPEDLKDVSEENLYTLLVELQVATRNLMMEGWRRGLQEKMATKAMEMKNDVPRQ